mgnify:CR=1 FL=1
MVGYKIQKLRVDNALYKIYKFIKFIIDKIISIILYKFCFKYLEVSFFYKLLIKYSAEFI